jgi:hypothetical protein
MCARLSVGKSLDEPETVDEILREIPAERKTQNLELKTGNAEIEKS